MRLKFLQFLVFIAGVMTIFDSHAAADSYRFLHVTIETPWAIFIFLLGFILTPFVLMAALYWYFAFKKGKEEMASEEENQEQAVPQTPIEKTSE